MENPKISIIVPVYNVEQYLPRCIDSILAQTFSDFEVLLVDDGSRDRSGTICDEYAAKDYRVRVFHKPNGGVSSARNVGLENAKGKWIGFIDSDDIIPTDGFDTLVGLASTDVDMVMAGYRKIDENGMLVEGPTRIVSKTVTWEQALTEMFKPTDYDYQGYCFSKLYRTSVVRDNAMTFNQNIKFNEDRLFVVDFICRSKRPVAYTTKPVYTYLLREGNTMGSLSKGYNRNFATDFDAFMQMCDIVKASTNDETLRQYVKAGLCGSYTANHKMMINGNAYDKAIHTHMFRGLMRKGALLLYVKQVLRQFIGNIGLLFFPRLIAKIYSGGVNKPHCQYVKLTIVAAQTERRAA